MQLNTNFGYYVLSYRAYLYICIGLLFKIEKLDLYNFYNVINNALLKYKKYIYKKYNYTISYYVENI